MVSSNIKDCQIKLIFKSKGCAAMDFQLTKDQIDSLLEALKTERPENQQAFYEIPAEAEGQPHIVGVDLNLVSHYIISETPTIVVPKKIINPGIN